MGNFKHWLIIISIIVVILIGCFIHFKPQRSKGIENINDKKNSYKTNYDEEKNLYYITNTNTNEIIAVGETEEELRFYIDRPDFNPSPFMSRSINLDDYVVNKEKIEE